jgi:hypothetical protein
VLLGGVCQGFAGADSSRVAFLGGSCSLRLGLESACQRGLTLLLEELGGGSVIVGLLLGESGRDLGGGVLPRLGGGRWGGRHGEHCTARAGARGVGGGRKDLNLGG